MAQKLFRNLRTGLLSILSSILLANAADAADKPYVLGTLRNPADVLPLMQYSGQTNVLRGLIFPPVLYVQNDGRIRCQLCKDVPSVEVKKGESGTFVISVELKKGFRWGDGKNVTARDVKFTLENMAKAPYPAGQHPILPIKKIELDKDNERKLTLQLSHRRSDAFQLFAISLLPAHRAADLAAVGNQPDKILALFKDPAFSYGPYRIASEDAQGWQLVVNEKTEWDSKPDQDLTLRFFSKVEDLTAALKSGTVDQSDELDWTAYNSLRHQWPEVTSKYEASSTPSSQLQVLLFNLHSPLFVNPQLRQAFYYAINRAELNKFEYAGLAEPSIGIITEGFAKRLELKRMEAFNPKLATQILDQSGWTKGPDGIRASEGQKFVVTLSCPAGRLDDKWIALLKNELSPMGIRLEVENPEAADYMKKVVSQRRFKDLACASWNLPSLSIPNNIFHSLAIPTRENNYFGSNYSGWDQHVVDKLLDNMLREIELHPFTRQFGRLEKQFLSDLPAVPLVFEPKVTLTLKTPVSSPSEELSRVLRDPAAPKKL